MLVVHSYAESTALCWW